jgi:hypothetical protein
VTAARKETTVFLPSLSRLCTGHNVIVCVRLNDCRIGVKEQFNSDRQVDVEEGLLLQQQV